MESRSQDMADDIGNFFQGDGTAFGGKAPMGLKGIVDDGTNLASYGGLSRATYSGLNATVTASGGTISLLKVRQLYLQRHHASGGFTGEIRVQLSRDNGQ